jgi:hypothetical protein
MTALKVANPPIVQEPYQPRVKVTAAPIQIDTKDCPQRTGGVHRGPWLPSGACGLCGFTARTMRAKG